MKANDVVETVRKVSELEFTNQSLQLLEYLGYAVGTFSFIFAFGMRSIRLNK